MKRWPRFRLGLQILALLAGAPCLLLTGFAPAVTTMLVMSAAYGVCRGCFEVNTHASLFDVIPSEHRSTATGIFMVLALAGPGLKATEIPAISAVLQMMEPMALP